MKQYKIKHDEYRLKCVLELKNKLRSVIDKRKSCYMNAIRETAALSMEEFDSCCFAVTALCSFEKFLDSPWAFLEMHEKDVYILPIEDLEMMISNPDFSAVNKYLILCEDSKEIIQLSDRLFQEYLIDALDMVVYKKTSQKERI